MLDHLEIYVSDKNNSKRFYSWLLEKLDYKLFQDWEEGFSYKKDNFYIVFVQVADKYLAEGYNRCRIGLNHLAFAIDDEKMLRQLREDLKKRNVKLLYDEKFPHAGGKNHYALYFEDEDRIKLEIVKR